MKLDGIPRFSSHELTIGSLLGEGGFCIVHTITKIQLNAREPLLEHDQMMRENLVNSNDIVVVKRIRNDLIESEERKAIADLALEVNFLAQLEHENIIKIRGISDHESFHKNSFAVLDLLRETLDLRIKKRWKREVHKASGVFGCCCSNPDKLRDLWVDRLTVARDIANAIHFLHSRNILYRDLKPDNVGFDLDGVVKLFDFGLAKDVSNEHRIGGFYKLTGNTGSLRYMAPEVYLDLMYDESVDVYSFGILLWQLCDLTTPFVGFNRKLHATMVIGRQHRPKINPKWQPGLKALISNCWAHESSLRPDFKTVLSLLFEEANQLSKLFEKRYDSSFV